MDQRLQIVRHNQEIIYSQRDEPLQEFPDVFLQTTTMRRMPTTTRRQRMTSSRLHFIALSPFWCLDDKGGEECYLY
jgi:hypothetical protein